MSKQVLDISQMQHLKELGVDTSNASCYTWYAEGKEYLYWGKCKDSNGTPVFTLQDILDLLPTEINKDGHSYYIEMYRNQERYYLAYYWLDNLLISLNEVEFIDAAYEMLCWVIENGYLDTK